MATEKISRSQVDQQALPLNFPTHAIDSLFWEHLGRTVGAFGFLEEVLTKAIFAFTATRKYTEEEFEVAYEKWLLILERSISDPLGGLIDTYGKSVRENSESTIENLDEFLEDLKSAAKIRNVLCHGSWRKPDKKGATIPFFVSKRNEVFDIPIDINYLKNVNRNVVALICFVIDTVTHMGWQFPSSDGPGKSIWPEN